MSKNVNEEKNLPEEVYSAIHLELNNRDERDDDVSKKAILSILENKKLDYVFLRNLSFSNRSSFDFLQTISKEESLEDAFRRIDETKKNEDKSRQVHEQLSFNAKIITFIKSIVPSLFMPILSNLDEKQQNAIMDEILFRTSKAFLVTQNSDPTFHLNRYKRFSGNKICSLLGAFNLFFTYAKVVPRILSTNSTMKIDSTTNEDFKIEDLDLNLFMDVLSYIYSPESGNRFTIINEEDHYNKEMQYIHSKYGFSLFNKLIDVMIKPENIIGRTNLIYPIYVTTTSPIFNDTSKSIKGYKKVKTNRDKHLLKRFPFLSNIDKFFMKHESKNIPDEKRVMLLSKYVTAYGYFDHEGAMTLVDWSSLLKLFYSDKNKKAVL
ncbi:MAG: hypothetical protein HOG49_14840 [Candidatus Scalindua sp.]|jgi:hypothetical protein|nr:hypothetical protein [Candidatus Scalindua sp.]